VEADETTNEEDENLALGDAVKSLREAVEHRVKAFEEKFSLSKLPYKEKKEKKPYDDLYELGIIQPIMLKKLNDIRNTITHEQKYPSGKEKAAITELLEFTWYFIRSTDSFFGRNISGIIYCPSDLLDWFDPGDPCSEMEDPFDGINGNTSGCCVIDISAQNDWEIQIRGRELPIALFSKTEKDGWLELNCYDLNDEPTIGVNDFLKMEDEWTNEDDEREDRERVMRMDQCLISGEKIKSFEGNLISPPEKLRAIIKLYFALYMRY